jgi:thiazole/oxazole-forming peptide maturase SagD family component
MPAEHAELDLEIAETPACRPSIRSRLNDMAEALASSRTGIVNAVEGSHHPVAARRLFLYSVAAGDPDRMSGERWMFGNGVSWNRQHAVAAALAEGFERHIWSRRSGQPAFLTSEDIHDKAFRASEFVRNSEAEAASHDKHDHAPFDPTAHPYLAGRDLLSDRLRWALAGTVLPAYDHPSGHGYACDATSTGMAAGSDSAMALAGGTAEVIERDAFTISHLNRLLLPEIDLRTVADPEFQAVLAATTQRPGVRVRAWDMTLDIRVPTILCAFAIDIDGEPAIRLGAATHASARTAMRKAFGEAAKISSLVYEERVRLNRRQAQPVTPATTLRGPDDHGALGDLGDYLATLDWLLHPRTALKDFGELEALSCPTEEPAEVLEWLLLRLKERALSAYGFELTTPDMKDATGLEVWRVLIPGAQPLTFGGPCVGLDSERLRWAPVRAGFRTSPLPDDDFNPLPHCFS